MADGVQKDWRELCVAVQDEGDSTKLTSLVQELIEALDKGERSWRHTSCPPDGRSRRIGTRLQNVLTRCSMADAPRITVNELKKRMESGEDFTVIDVRNPNAWAETGTVIPEAIRVPLDKLEENLPRIPKNRPVVAYCT